MAFVRLDRHGFYGFLVGINRAALNAPKNQNSPKKMFSIPFLTS
jgi:hypothetical protein